MKLHLEICTLSVVAMAAGLVGCDSGTSDRLAEAERGIEAQGVQLESLSQRLSDLETKVFVPEITKELYKSATFDPSDRGFGRLDTSVGTFAVSIQAITAHADGVRVRLHVGNLTTATISGGQFKAKWGTRMPKMEGKGWVASYSIWQKSLSEKEINFLEELRPGTWNNVTLNLPGLPPDKFGYLELQMESSQIKLLAPRS